MTIIEWARWVNTKLVGRQSWNDAIFVNNFNVSVGSSPMSVINFADLK